MRPSRELSRLPLFGIKVLDLSRDLAGPFCAQILSDLGAEVIKVENPEGGDEMRHWPPQFEGQGIYYMITNRNKSCVALDLRDATDREHVLRMVDEADVIVHNFRDVTAAKLGVDVDTLRGRNPGAVVCSIRGYGPGRNAGRAAYDSAMQAYSGIMSLTGDPDGEVARVGVAICDFTTGQYAALGVLGALRRRDQTGEGEHVEVSLAESAMATMSMQVMTYLLTGFEFGRLGTSHPTTVPSRVFHTRTNDILLLAANDRQWASLCAVLGHPEWAADPRFATNPLRVDHRAEIEGLIQAVLRDRDADDWSARLDASVVPHAVVRTVKDVSTDPDTQAWVERVPHPLLGDIPLVPSPIVYGGERLPIRSAPPLLGEHDQLQFASVEA